VANPFAAAAARINASAGSGPHLSTGSTTFAGASMGRLYGDFEAGNFSPDYELRAGGRLLRARARRLCRDNGYMSGFLGDLRTNVVGPTGIKLKSKVTTVTDTLHQATNDKIEAAWSDWSLPENCSADRHDDWPSLQRLIMSTIAMDGECILRKRPYFGNAHGFALQLIDSDQLDEYYNRLPDPNGAVNEIRLGVEVDRYYAPVAYHIWNRHPADGGLRFRERVDASEIIHLFVRYRTNQTRGVTWLAPVITDSWMYGGYTEAELVAARVHAAQMGVIKTTDPMNGTALDPNEEPKQRKLTAAAGTFAELLPGQELQMFAPEHPSTAFKDFTNTILRGIARGLGNSYMTFTGDLNGTSYSSGRIGLLAERDLYRTIQFWLMGALCRPVYLEWIRNALLTGAVKLDSRLASDYSDVAWKARGWGWIDPLKDVQSRILGIQHGMDSRTDALEDEGEDLEDTFQKLQREQELAAKYDIEIVPAAPLKPRPWGTASEADQEEGQQQDQLDQKDDSKAMNDDGTDARGLLPQFARLLRVAE